MDSRQKNNLLEGTAAEVVNAEIQPSRRNKYVCAIKLGKSVEAFLGLVGTLIGRHYCDFFEVVGYPVGGQVAHLCAGHLAHTSCEYNFLVSRQHYGLGESSVVLSGSDYCLA